eukprot:5380919-Alexandrium_andersonii.AAC.1
MGESAPAGALGRGLATFPKGRRGSHLGQWCCSSWAAVESRVLHEDVCQPLPWGGVARAGGVWGAGARPWREQ